jgi:two-component system phosphate regulon response regulator PhoB
MAAPVVLVIDDEKDVQELLRYNLEKSGFEVVVAKDGDSGLQAAAASLPDAILLDIMMPGLDGLGVCRKLREEPRTAKIPIIFLTAKAGEADRVVGLELGADDYVVKPFSPRELIARIRAVLRRTAPASGDGGAVRRGDLVIDPARHEVTWAGKPVVLTATEFRILHHLASRPGRVFSRTDIIDGALGRDIAVVDRTIDVHLTALRRKLGKGGAMIETVRGFGYRFQDAGPAKGKGRS